MHIEEQFREYVMTLRQQGIGNIQRHLKYTSAEDVPEPYRAAFSFWASLSGPSRNLMLDVVQGRRVRKMF